MNQAITQTQWSGWDMERYLRKIEEVVNGVNCIQPDALILREKDLAMSDYFNLAAEVKNLCREAGVKCIMHNYAEVAEKLQAECLHLPYAEFTQYMNSGLELGTSVHSVEDALHAQQAGASYVTAGHIFATDCKKGLPPRGLQFLEEVCKSVDIPVYAIGGITEENAQECIRAGAAGVCIMSGYMREKQ